MMAVGGVYSPRHSDACMWRKRVWAVGRTGQGGWEVSEGSEGGGCVGGLVTCGKRAIHVFGD